MTRPSLARTNYPAIALVLLTAAFMVVRTARDALYFQADGLFALPKAYVAMAILAVPQAMIVLLLLRRLGGRILRVAALAVVACVIVLFQIMAEPGGGPLMTGFFGGSPLRMSDTAVMRIEPVFTTP